MVISYNLESESELTPVEGNEMQGKILKDKVIVISGGTKGIGRGVALKAAEEGAKVVIGGRSEKDANEIIMKIKNTYNSEAIFVKGDISNVSDCKSLIREAVKEYGKIDGLFNYAGITSVGSILDTEQELFDRVMNINVRSAFFCTKYAVKYMRENGGGSIINAGSTHAYGGGNSAAYTCSKGTLLTLTKHISKNFAKDKIRCNYLTIGWVATPSEIELKKSQGKDENWINDTAKSIMPMGRLQTVEDHVPGVIYLFSDLSTQVTGIELHVSGGFFV